MKIRTDFVTNSSSSSFTLSLKIELKNGETLCWDGYGYEEYEYLDDEEYGRVTGCGCPNLYAEMSPKRLAKSRDTASLAAALKKAVWYEERDGSVHEVLADEAEWIEKVEKIPAMADIAKISVEGTEQYSCEAEWGQFFEYDCVNKKYVSRYTGVEYGAIDGAGGGTLYVPDADKAEISEFVIEDGVFWYRGRAEEVTVPAGVTEIGEKAFASWDRLRRVTVPEGVTKIGESAFCLCWSLERIDLPDSLKEISVDAFENCNGGLTIHAPEGSYAQSYAEENAIRFEPL